MSRSRKIKYAISNLLLDMGNGAIQPECAERVITAVSKLSDERHLLGADTWRSRKVPPLVVRTMLNDLSAELVLDARYLRVTSYQRSLLPLPGDAAVLRVRRLDGELTSVALRVAQ